MGMLQQVWSRTGHGALAWTATDSLARDAPVVGSGCLTSMRGSASSRPTSVWIADPSVWPHLGWSVAWLRTTSASRSLLVVPSRSGPFAATRSVDGTVYPVSGVLRRSDQRLSAAPQEAFLILQDAASVAAACGARRGVFRRLDVSPPATLDRDGRSSSVRVVPTPGGMAYSAWRSGRRILLGATAGILLALVLITVGAASFWSAGQAPAWAIARLSGATWAVLRWQVLVEATWLLGPGLAVGSAATYALLRTATYYWGFPFPRGGLFAFSIVCVVVVTLGTLAVLLLGRMRRLSPMDGLREAREWRG